MKAHELAQQLLAGPNLPIFHFDPSRAGLDDEADTSTSDPRIERVTLDDEYISDAKERAEELGRELLTDFLTINGDTDEEGEAKTDREGELEELLRSACAIADRKGEGTAWDRFLASAAKVGVNGITARSYRVLPHEMADN